MEPRLSDGNTVVPLCLPIGPLVVNVGRIHSTVSVSQSRVLS